MQDKELIKIFTKLIKSQPFCCLSTVDEKGFPETRDMLNLCNPEIYSDCDKISSEKFTTYFTTNTSSGKMKNIVKNDKASVYYVNAEKYEGLLLTGTVEIVNDMKTKKDLWAENWKMYYSGGFEDPDYAVLKFTAEKYEYYNGSLEVKSGKI